MKYASLFSGAGGLDLAVEEVFGAQLVWYSEINRDACKVMAKHWPDVPNVGDITKVDWASVEPVDLICGGPPCQPVSVAGKRKGPQDDRFLWPAVLDALGRLSPRPRWLAFENPSGVTPFVPAICFRLSELGYVGRGGVLSAASVGACHLRERWFLVAHSSSERRGGDTGAALAQKEPDRRWTERAGDLAASSGDGLLVADSDSEGRGEQRGRGVFDSQRPPDVPPKYFATRIPRSPDGSIDRLTFWVNTLGASAGWDLEAEHRARVKLRTHLSEHQWRHYELTGTFLETSKRSGLIYMFRRSRPTIALSPRWPWWGSQPDSMRCLATLCMHPVGFYQRSWAGCMVPSDDLIAYLLFMRADEARYWKFAIQHEPWQAEAGL